MRRHLVARLWQSLIVIILVTTISFVVIRLAPGDPFSYDAGTITPAVREYWREQFGYNRPIPEQFSRYVASVLHGQLGYSFQMHEPVSRALADTVPRTLLLGALALGVSFLFGIVVGVLQAVRRGAWFDRISSMTLLILYSLPDFWGALIILLIFAYWWPVLPAGNIVDPVLHDYMTPWAAIVDRLRHLVLPVLTLALLTTAGFARFQRAAMLDVLPADYIRTARAKGLTERQVIWKHALRTALTPMVTLLGLALPGLLGGALFIENVFGWPGMGSLAASAIRARDYDLVSAVVVVGSVIVVVGNLVADLLHMAIDPRVRA
ncbi:MAG TPA: ABC transporter permease [Gemmatimonadaceae bacterium]|nr:ABC transporter permease [Gemmatimonadaceae bacterium]